MTKWVTRHAQGKCRGENIHKLTCAKYLMEKLLIEMRFFVFQSNVEVHLFSFLCCVGMRLEMSVDHSFVFVISMSMKRWLENGFLIVGSWN